MAGQRGKKYPGNRAASGVQRLRHEGRLRKTAGAMGGGEPPGRRKGDVRGALRKIHLFWERVLGEEFEGE